MRAKRALDELSASAPAFAEQARVLASMEKFDEAIEKLAYAFRLSPNAPEYLVRRGNLLQSQFRLSEAAEAYRAALRLDPADARTRSSAKLCEELLAAPAGTNGGLSLDSLSKLYTLMQQQQRTSAELMPVARLLGEEKKLLVNYWTARLNSLPISGDQPLEKRLTVREDGLLAFDLCNAKLADVAPLVGMPLGELNLCNCAGLSDLSPLRNVRTLASLNLSSTAVRDLSALNGLALTQCNLTGTRVFDLTPLRGMPLKHLILRSSRVADLRPISGMPIEKIDLVNTPVLDFSPLSGLPLWQCYLEGTRIADLGILSKMPLKELVLARCDDARNYRALTEIQSLELLLLPDDYRFLPAEELAAIEALRRHPALRQIGTVAIGRMMYASTDSKEEFWRDWDREAKFLTPLRAGNHVADFRKLTDGTYQFSANSSLADLSLLSGAPISELSLRDCNVTNLASLTNLPLRLLNLDGAPVSELDAVRGMPIKGLWLGRTRVRDLSPLKSLPLRWLDLSRCESVTNVAMLAEMPALERVVVPLGAEGIEALRSLPRLHRIGFRTADSEWDMAPICTAEVFWRTWDSQPWARALKQAGRYFVAEQGADGLWKVTVRAPTLNECSIFALDSIRELDLRQTSVVAVEPLLQCRNLQRLVLPEAARDIQVLRTLPTLTALSYDSRDDAATASDFWKDFEQPWVRALQESGYKVNKRIKLRDGSWELNLQDVPIDDVTFLTNAPISILSIGGTAVTNLAPLRGMKLKVLHLFGTKVTDLSPLEGLSIENLNMAGVPVADLSPLRGMPLTSLRLHGCPNVTNVSVLASLTSLRELTLPSWAAHFGFLRDTNRFPHLRHLAFKEDANRSWRPVTTAAEFWRELDLRNALARGGLTPKRLSQLADGTWEIDLTGSSIQNLGFLHDMPVSALLLGATRVADLTPLQGMKLKKLWLYETEVSELSPLRGMPIEDLHLAATKIADLSPVVGMPLTSLRLHGCSQVTNLSPLAGLASLRELTLPPHAKGFQFLRDAERFRNLTRLGYEEDKERAFRVSQSASAFWKDYDQRAWQTPLEAAGIKPKGLVRLPDDTWELNLVSTPIRDLAILSNAPISILWLGSTTVSNLAPLRGMKLKKLYLCQTLITDLSPLQGMPLHALNLVGTRVTDLSPLRGLPLSSLRLHDCPRITDISALRGMETLKDLTLPPNAKDIVFLRSVPRLEFLSFRDDPRNQYRPAQTTGEFWAEYDQKAQKQ